jgi:hypothetical protein
VLKYLKLQTVHGLINLAIARRQFAALTRMGPQDVLEILVPTTPSGKASQELTRACAKILSGLPREEQIELVALMWLGRSGGTLEEWRDHARSTADAPDSNLVEYVLIKVHLDTFLDDGLERLGLPRSNARPATSR